MHGETEKPKKVLCNFSVGGFEGKFNRKKSNKI